MPDTTATAPGPEPFRVPDENLDDLASSLAKTMAEVKQHGVLLDRLGSEPTPAPPADGRCSSNSSGLRVGSRPHLGVHRCPGR